MTAPNHLPNEQQLARGFLGTELETGDAVTPTYRIYGALEVTRTEDLADTEEYGGDFFPDREPVYGPVSIAGTYAQPLSFEDLAILPRYGMEAAPAGVSDGETTPGYLYEYRPDQSSVTRDTATVETGFPGLPFRATGLHWGELTISADIDDAQASWRAAATVLGMSKTLLPNLLAAETITSATATVITKTAAGWTIDAFIGAYLEIVSGVGIGQIREVIDNDTTTITVSPAFVTAPTVASTFNVSARFTPGIADRVRETISAAGTDVFIDAYDGGTIGTTNERHRTISWSVTQQFNSSPKNFMDSVDGPSRFGKGGTRVTGQLVMEFDSREEYDAWVNKELKIIRFAQTGSAIDSGAGTTKEARIDVYRAAFSTPSQSTRENNVILTIPFRGYLDPVESTLLEVAAKVELATLP